MSLPINRYHCQVCNVYLNSQVQLNQHYAGSKHKVKANVSGNPGASSQTNQAKIEKIKSAGKDYFVKEGACDTSKTSVSGTGTCPVASQTNLNNSSYSSSSIAGQTSLDSSTLYRSTPIDGQASCDTVSFCSTCRINMRSPQQAETHYRGSKHRNKVKLLQEAMESHGGGNNLGATCFDDPNAFCATCRVKFTSGSQALMHYSGAKHLQKLKITEDVEENNSIAAGVQPKPSGTGCESTCLYCYVCRAKFTSKSQAEVHYRGGKHKQKLRLLEETKHIQSQSHVEGEPSAKKSKYMEMCTTCNVVLTCADMASSHYNGSKHQKKLALLKSIGDQQNCLLTNGSQYPTSMLPPPPPPDNVGVGRPIQKGDGLAQGGHLYCSFCDLRTNSQAQMDSHRAGSKHKAKVEGIAKVAPKMVNSATHSMSVTYSMTSTVHSSFPNHYQILPGNPHPQPTAGSYPFMNAENPGAAPFPVY